MKCKIFGILIVLCVFLNCASPGTKQAKLYQGQLETMIGKKSYDVTAAIRDWKFELISSWEEEDPTAEDVKKRNSPVVEFTDLEIQGIFSEEGKYLVMFYSKKEATSDASIGTIDEMGMTYLRDTAIASDRYTLIRAVFKDGVFTHFKVRGNIHQTSISGLKRIRR
jgi:hypothetical protein